MMAQSTPFAVLVAALLISTLSYCSAENVYCVTPTAGSCSSCPHNATNCTTLSEYAHAAELYFTSDTTMVFLPGNHALVTNITVANITRLTMRGETSSCKMATSTADIANVVCRGSVGLSFTSMVELKIQSLAFASCSRQYAFTIILPGFPTNINVYVAMFLQSTQYAELVNCSFHDNLATALLVNSTDITLSGNTEFTHNQVHCGNSSTAGGYLMTVGGIAAVGSDLTFTGSTNFLENSGYCRGHGGEFFGGGAIFVFNDAVLTFNGTNNFINNSANGGGAIYVFDNAVLTFNGTSNFINNSANGGGAIFISNNTALSFCGTSNFIDNSADYGGAIYISNSVTSISGTSNFINSLANYGGAIFASFNNILTFSGIIFFTNNGHYGEEVDILTGCTGGGVLLGLNCTFSILPNTTVYWENNHATIGGAVCVYDASPISYCTAAPYVPKEDCFFQLPGQNLSNGIDVQLIFKNNTADVAGSVLYGGVIDNCKLTGLNSDNSGEVFDMLVHNDTDCKTSSYISSDPLYICPCASNFANCRYLNFPHTVHLGETFQVSVVAVGQRGGTVPSRVIGTIDNDKYPGTSLLDSQHLQQANNICTTLSYTVLSLSKIQQVNIRLYAAESPCSKFRDYTLEISVSLHQTCPPGFQFTESAKSCVCDLRLAHYTNNCNITNGVGQITRKPGDQFWVGYDIQSDELILHPHCPFDYCVSHDEVVFSLNNTEKQCAHNRSDLLCGACKEGLSLVLLTANSVPTITTLPCSSLLR